MSPNSNRRDRNHSYVNGHIIQTGIALPGSPYETPGPGHYTGPIIVSPNKTKKQSPEKSFSLGSEVPRMNMSYEHTVIKNGIMVAGKDTSNGVGPGHYGTPGNNSLLKKSFNVKASPRGSPRSPRPTSSSSSPAYGYGSPMSMAGRMSDH